MSIILICLIYLSDLVIC